MARKPLENLITTFKNVSALIKNILSEKNVRLTEEKFKNVKNIFFITISLISKIELLLNKLINFSKFLISS